MAMPLTIVGVAADGFEGVEAGGSTDFWIPLQSRPELNAWGNPSGRRQDLSHDQSDLVVSAADLARLAPGVTRRRRLAQLQPVFQSGGLCRAGRCRRRERSPGAELRDAKRFPGYAEQYGKPLRILMAMVALVLLIALTNVVMLLMARNAARQREFSVRLALGAGRGELFRQLLTESAAAGVGGRRAGVGLCGMATRALGAWAQIESSLAPDRTVLLFTLGVLVVAALLFGLAPLRVALAAGPTLAMKTSAAASQCRLRARRRRAGRLWRCRWRCAWCCWWARAC